MTPFWSPTLSQIPPPSRVKPGLSRTPKWTPKGSKIRYSGGPKSLILLRLPRYSHSRSLSLTLSWGPQSTQLSAAYYCVLLFRRALFPRFVKVEKKNGIQPDPLILRPLPRFSHCLELTNSPSRPLLLTNFSSSFVQKAYS